MSGPRNDFAINILINKSMASGQSSAEGAGRAKGPYLNAI